MLAEITRVLYFPIVSLALYPRHWFPGNWMTVPIAVNSLLWGAALALIVVVGRRLRTRPVS
jgi:ABC-type arginine transport system permease subunit